MFNIIVKTIPHSEQRYETVGDWFWDADTATLRVMVSDLKNWKEEALVAIHEIIEAVLCEGAGIKVHSVDNFDMNFKGDGEPGDDPKAPYHEQHRFATRVEKNLARELNVKWREYDKHIDDLFYKPKEATNG